MPGAAGAVTVGGNGVSDSVGARNTSGTLYEERPLLAKYLPISSLKRVAAAININSTLFFI